MRSLIYVPIIHTMADLGTIAELLRREYIEKVGERTWRDHLQAVDEVWAAIREAIDKLPLDYAKAKLYQDGLPVCDREMEIVRQAAAAGSQNHQILLEMMNKGARLVGTESHVLLLEEYQMIRELAEISDAAEKEQTTEVYREASASLLERRDAFIARRIDETLEQGETGLLFVGLMHRVDEKLPRDIRVHYLFDRLPTEGGRLRRSPGRGKARSGGSGRRRGDDDG